MRRRNIITISLVTACCLLGDSMLYIALPIYWREAGLDAIWQVGVLLSINRFVRLPLNPLVGWIYEKISLKTGLLFAVILSVITTIGYGIAAGFIAWIILRCLWGLSWSFLRIGGLSTVSVYGESKKQGEAMGLYNGLYRLGSLVGMLGGGILTPFFGLSWVSISFGFVSAIGVVVLGLFFKTERNSRPKRVKKVYKTPALSLLRKNSLIMGSSFGVTFIIQGVFTSTLSTLIVYHYGEDVDLLSIVIASSALSGTLQALRWTWEPFLARKIGMWSDGAKGRIPYLIGALLIGGVSFPLLAFSFHPFLWIMITIVTLLVSTALTTLMDAAASDHSPDEGKIRFFTYYTIIQDLGAAAGPLAGYLLISLAFGYEMLYMGCALIFLLFMIFWMNKRKKQLSSTIG
ncbi:MFS transporter [Alteribacillus sp. HJP-4]